MQYCVDSKLLACGSISMLDKGEQLDAHTLLVIVVIQYEPVTKLAIPLRADLYGGSLELASALALQITAVCLEPRI